MKGLRPKCGSGEEAMGFHEWRLLTAYVTSPFLLFCIHCLEVKELDE